MPDNITTSDPVAEVAERALKKTSVITLDGWSATEQRYLFVAPYDCTIDQVWLVSDTTHAAHDTNYYSFQVQNLTAAAGAALFGADHPDNGWDGHHGRRTVCAEP